MNVPPALKLRGTHTLIPWGGRWRQVCEGPSASDHLGQTESDRRQQEEEIKHECADCATLPQELGNTHRRICASWPSLGRPCAKLLSQGIANLPAHIPTYLTAATPPPRDPPRLLCSVCGHWGKYKCKRCVMPYCDLNCEGVHNETRCERRVI